MSDEYDKFVDENERLAEEISNYNPGEDPNGVNLSKLREELIMLRGYNPDIITEWLSVYGFKDKSSGNTNKGFSFLENFFKNKDEQLPLFA